MWIKALAKSLLLVVGVFTLIKAIESMTTFMMMLAMTSLEHCDLQRVLTLVICLIVPTVLFLTSLLLIFRPPLRVLDAITENPSESEVRTISARVVLHTVSIFLGVFLLFWAGPKLAVFAFNYFIIGEFGEHFIGMSAGCVIQVVGGVYFLIGAPHFVNWQLRKLEEPA